MRRIGKAGLLLACVVVLGACMHSRVEENWGRSYEAQVVWQTADPEAPASREPVEGIDPETAARIAERYYKGQEEQRRRQAPSVLIGELK